MRCVKCEKEMILTNNPNYKEQNLEHETHLVYICMKCNEPIKREQLT